MPKDLPGFYFDTERNRYFPISSRPAAAGPSTINNKFPKRENSGIQQHDIRSKRQRKADRITSVTPRNNCLDEFDSGGESRDSNSRRRTTFSHANSRVSIMRYLKHSLAHQERTRATHKLHCKSVASTSHSECTRLPIFGNITAFCSSLLEDGPPRRYIGDDQGWLYSCSHDEQMYMWPTELNLHLDSQISSIDISGQKCVATCVGPVTRLAVINFNATNSLTTLITLKKIFDVRTSQLQGNSIVLGASKKAVYIPDIEVSNSVRYLHNENDSDVFATEQDKPLIYTGTRDGVIRRFDTRVSSVNSCQKMFCQKMFHEPKAARSPVLYLKLVKGSQLLVSQMNGDLNLFDIRFPVRATPALTFEGHVNTISQKLGIAVDTSQNFLFAAGEDSRIRGWSLRTAEPLNPISLRPPDSPSISPMSPDTTMDIDASCSFDPSLEASRSWNPFLTEYPSAVTTIQVTEEHDRSMCLWAGAKQFLFQHNLGQISSTR